MLKDEREYKYNYGEVPKDFLERLSYILSTMDVKRFGDKIFERVKYINNIKREKIDILIYLEPKSTPRPRNGRGVFYVKGAADNRKRFKKFMDREQYPMITTPMIFNVKTYFKVPSSMSNMEKVLAELGFIRPISYPDWDNVGKTYSDMVQEQLILDDDLVIDGRVRKYYSFKPRVEIYIEYMTEHDSLFNERKVMKKLEGRRKKNEK